MSKNEIIDFNIIAVMFIDESKSLNNPIEGISGYNNCRLSSIDFDMNLNF